MAEHLLCVRFLCPDALFNLGSKLGVQIWWVMHLLGCVSRCEFCGGGSSQTLALFPRG